MSKQYTQGRNIEYQIVRYFKKLGYEAWRTAGSHGPFDVIAVGPHDVTLAQVKSYRDKHGSYAKDIEKLHNLKCPSYIKKVMIIYKIGTGIEKVEEVK